MAVVPAMLLAVALIVKSEPATTVGEPVGPALDNARGVVPLVVGWTVNIGGLTENTSVEQALTAGVELLSVTRAVTFIYAFGIVTLRPVTKPLLVEVNGTDIGEAGVVAIGALHADAEQLEIEQALAVLS